MPVPGQGSLLPQAPRLAGALYKLILLIVALIRLLVSPLAWLERPPQRQEHLALPSNYRWLVRTLPGM